jgi:hypothetical protein
MISPFYLFVRLCAPANNSWNNWYIFMEFNSIAKYDEIDLLFPEIIFINKRSL